MGEEQKKEKNRVEGSKAFIKKYFIKKKTITQHQIFVEATGFRLELLGFRCSCWVLAEAVGSDNGIEIQMRRKKRERDVGSG